MQEGKRTKFLFYKAVLSIKGNISRKLWADYMFCVLLADTDMPYLYGTQGKHIIQNGTE